MTFFIKFNAQFIKISNQLLENIEKANKDSDIIKNTFDLNLLNKEFEKLFVDFSNLKKYSEVSLNLNDILFKKVQRV